jgi:hypothetical protein
MKYKNVIIIVSVLIIITIIIYIAFFTNFYFVKSLEFKGCKVNYYYSLNNFYYDESNVKTGGHGKSNDFLYKSAQYNLLKCLCDKYIKTKDQLIKNRIVDFVKSDELTNEYYILNVIEYNAPIDSLCKYKDLIFKDDSITDELCKQYQMNYENDLKNKIIRNFRGSRESRFWYSTILKITKISNPDIDSICKYKEVVFGPIWRD